MPCTIPQDAKRQMESTTHKMIDSERCGILLSMILRVLFYNFESKRDGQHVLFPECVGFVIVELVGGDVVGDVTGKSPDIDAESGTSAPLGVTHQTVNV